VTNRGGGAGGATRSFRFGDTSAAPWLAARSSRPGPEDRSAFCRPQRPPELGSEFRVAPDLGGRLPLVDELRQGGRVAGSTRSLGGHQELAREPVALPGRQKARPGQPLLESVREDLRWDLGERSCEHVSDDFDPSESSSARAAFIRTRSSAFRRSMTTRAALSSCRMTRLARARTPRTSRLLQRPWWIIPDLVQESWSAECVTEATLASFLDEYLPGTPASYLALRYTWEMLAIAAAKATLNGRARDRSPR
jgi:hypothetical protein